jgi:hypothetical protein
MNRGTFRLKAIALIAAYAVAMQGLLSAFVPIAVALPAGILCSDQTMDGPAAPAGHGPSCTSACAMLGAAAAPPPPDVAIGGAFVRSAHQAIPTPAPSVAAPRGLQTARAPPLV